MAAKGLTKDIIVKEAIKYIEETNLPLISLHEIARRLGIKTPSLYNHIKSNKELEYLVYEYAINKFVAVEKTAIEGKTCDEAVKSFAEAYFSFAKENIGLYKLIMSIPSKDDQIANELALPLLKLVVQILHQYQLDEKVVAHYQRVFRAILHGFIAEEELGYFFYYKNIELQTSRQIAVDCFLDGLHKAKNITKN